MRRFDCAVRIHKRGLPRKIRKCLRKTGIAMLKALPVIF